MISPVQSPAVIRLRGVRQNNLKNVDCEIPLYQLTVITGVSGSGKSSLAFDTLYAEGQRRYLETFSAYTRQFLERIARPDIESIEGIPPAVAIDPYGAIKTSRSTVGTMTGLNDYLKLLYARAAEAFCPHCGEKVEPESTEAVLEAIRAVIPDAYPLLIVAPVDLAGFDSVEIVQRSLSAQGYVRYLSDDGEVCRIEKLTAQDIAGSTVHIVVDRLTSPSVSRQRRADSVEQAFRLGSGTAIVQPAGSTRQPDGGRLVFSEGLRCGACDSDFLKPSPGLFSFNNPYGACSRCRGFGRTIGIDWGRVIPQPELSLDGGAIKPWATKRGRPAWRRCRRDLHDLGISTDVPFSDYPRKIRDLILHGSSEVYGVRDFFTKLERKQYKMHVRVFLSRFRGYERCEDCQGARLRPEALAFRVLGRTLPEMWELPIRDLAEVFEQIGEQKLNRPLQLLVDEIRSRVDYLHSVGLGYVTLGRQSRTLSGGEVERVNLTSALGACLVNTLFVLDEPSIGLHARDNERLLEILRAVKDCGNTVVVVEHDPAIMSAADHLIDLGPGSGEHGGEIVAAGTVETVKSVPGSLTGQYLRGERSIEHRRERRVFHKRESLRIRAARENNLQNLDLDLPLGVLTVISGVSGSGKSTLLEDIIWKSYLQYAGRASEGKPAVASLKGFDLVDDVVLVDQSPIGKTPRGNPATYTKVFDRIRQLLAGTESAIDLGFEARYFSFNVEAGRCPECAGAGATQVEMQFLSDVTLPCEACGGRRFKRDVLSVRYRGRNVHEILDLTIREAREFFAEDRALADKLTFLEELGLGYLRLGQSINTLSGGEAQRLKLAGRVMNSSKEKLLFLLDEPTTGLHLEDVRNLLGVLHNLVDRGHSVILIEHQLDVLAAADYLVDLGPEGGDQGGRLVAAGTPEEVVAGARKSGSITGRWLAPLLTPHTATQSQTKRRRRRSSAATRRSARGGVPSIHVVGARENNLRNINVDIPLEELVVVTGLSGSGKSSLLYNIVFAEGQRRFLDCLSPYARQFVEDLHRPDIDHLEGIPPTVAIEQRTTVGGRKSTVGTVTEIYQFLRLLYARVGQQICPECNVEVVPYRQEDVESEVSRLACQGGRLLAPVIRGKKGFHSKLLAHARRRGITEARIDGEWVDIPADRELRLARHQVHDIDLVVASFGRGKVAHSRVADAVAAGFDHGGGVVRFLSVRGRETIFNLQRSCPDCGRSYDEPDPRNFSFLSRHGRCNACDGYGHRFEIDPERLIDRWDVPLSSSRNNPLAFLTDPPFSSSSSKVKKTKVLKQLRELEKKGRLGAGILDQPLGKWSKRALRILFEGDSTNGFSGLASMTQGVLERLEDEDSERYLARWGRRAECSECCGGRLRQEWLTVQVGGRGIAQASRETIGELRRFFADLRWQGQAKAIGKPIVIEILSRLEFLEHVGLSYLTLDREAATLSTGEAQRIRLASQLGSQLRGACYILDEPTIGLHPRDNERLLQTLRGLRDRGNSVLVIEHDDATIEAADTILDLGPGPGRHGGEVVAQGTISQLLKSQRSATAAYLRRKQRTRPKLNNASLTGNGVIEIKGATRNNLKSVNARFPLGALTLVTGVSGAGKSTLVRAVLEQSVRRHLRGLRSPAVGCRAVEGAEQVSAVREVDQLPIGRTPRSTPATYVGLWDRIRNVFASTAESRARGYSKRRFSFNLSGGRCDACSGQGRNRMEMNFLPDVTVDCEACSGRRFNAETLEIRYRGKSIADVMEMTVEEAKDFFSSYPELWRSLGALEDLGLGYLALGQASTTLSGGEAQRVKLAVELAKTANEPCLYLLDEPTTGLHMLDVERLLSVLRRLAVAGHAVVVIEHHLELIAGADWVIDLGPEGGDDGGKTIYEGTPRGLASVWKRSHTGSCLREWVRG